MFSYQSGGGTWMTKFIVTDGDGDATFKLYVDGKKKDTITVTVEEGITYKIHVYVGTGSRTKTINDIKLTLLVSKNHMTMGLTFGDLDNVPTYYSKTKLWKNIDVNPIEAIIAKVQKTITIRFLDFIFLIIYFV